MTVDEAMLTLTRLWTERDRLRREMDAIAALIEANGCDCECGHHYEEHDDGCELCIVCRIDVHVTEARR
jgi:hypothetical protein